MENGTVIRIARKEVRSVPIRKGNVPNLLNIGSHVLPVRNLKPKTFMEGRELTRRERNMDKIRTKIHRAEIKSVFWNADSRICVFPRSCTLFLAMYFSVLIVVVFKTISEFMFDWFCGF